MPPDAAYIGIDLAWTHGRPSGGACLAAFGQTLRRTEVSGDLGSLEDVCSFIERNSAARTVVAVDAPLIVSNQEGGRPCDREVSRQYGSRHASCHSINLRRWPSPRGVALVDLLRALSFRHGHGTSEHSRSVIEVYPHAGLVAYFDLARILKYKKGRVMQRRRGLRALQERLKATPCNAPFFGEASVVDDPLLISPDELRGSGLKRLEDQLDALFCSLMAYSFDTSWEAMETFGDTREGYIVNYREPLTPLRPHHLTNR